MNDTVTGKPGRAREYVVFLVVVLLVSAALGALSGLYGARIGLTTPVRSTLIAIIALVTGRMTGVWARRRS